MSYIAYYNVGKYIHQSVMGSSQPKKNDFFGRKVKDKFPYYPYSVIIPRCGPGPPCVSGRSQKRGPRAQTLNQKCPKEELKVECRSQEIRPRPKSPMTASSHAAHCAHPGGKKVLKLTGNNKGVNTKELCRRIAEIVAREIPHIEDKFLEEIQDKCKRYWDCLIKHKVHLDEEAVFEILTQKIREWAENNSLHEANLPTSENEVEFVESEEDLEEMYGTVIKFSDSRFDS